MIEFFIADSWLRVISGVFYDNLKKIPVFIINKPLGRINGNKT